jgi:Alpha/beta hydrolase family
MKRHLIAGLPAALLLLGMPGSVFAQNTPSQANNPIVLKKQGTFYVGGTIEFRTPNSSTTVNGDPRSLPGNIAVHQMYVEYQVPNVLKYKYPIVFMHGGGHTGQFFRTTPDGRDGWFTSFTKRGFAVYSVDGSNRGRAGWDPTNRFAASQGLVPPQNMEAANMYSEQSAWVAFRWGPTNGTWYDNTQFPKDYKDDYLRQIQPAYRDPTANPFLRANVQALIDKIGPCILVGWSTGSTNVMQAASSPSYAPKVKGLIGLEGFTAGSGGDPNLVKNIPQLTVLGDHLDPTPNQAWSATINGLGGDSTTVYLPDVGIVGNGHTFALELNNEQIADLVENWIKEHVK